MFLFLFSVSFFFNKQQKRITQKTFNREELLKSTACTSDINFFSFLLQKTADLLNNIIEQQRNAISSHNS